MCAPGLRGSGRTLPAAVCRAVLRSQVLARTGEIAKPFSLSSVQSMVA
jgi:hypothetical protein